ncbi:MAG: class I SAM-dependent methyltransferase [Promethearchaeota archaeon]
MESRHQPAIDFYLNFIESKKDHIKGVSNELRRERGREPFILDIGCGSGHLLFSLLRAHPWVLEFCKLKGVDISAAMIKLAERGISSVEDSPGVHADRVEFIHSNVLDISFEDRSCAVISSLESIYYVSDMVQVISMFYRMLVEGGTLLFMIEDDMIKSGDELIDSKRMDVLRKEINIDTFHFLSIDEYKDLTMNAGFQGVDMKSRDGFVYMRFTK